MKNAKNFDEIQKEAELLLESEMNEIVGGTTSSLMASGCGACCQYLGGGGSAGEEILAKAD